MLGLRSSFYRHPTFFCRNVSLCLHLLTNSFRLFKVRHSGLLRIKKPSQLLCISYIASSYLSSEELGIDCIIQVIIFAKCQMLRCTLIPS